MASNSRNAMARRQAANQPMQKNPVSGSLGTIGNSNMRRPPGQSMGAQIAFSQTQQPPQQYNASIQQQQFGQKNSRINAKQPIQMQERMDLKQQAPPPKITVSDAIGLTTMRLSKVEEQLIEVLDQIKNKYDDEYNQNNYFNSDTASNEILSETKTKLNTLEHEINTNKKDIDNAIKSTDVKFKTFNSNLQKHVKEQSNFMLTTKNDISDIQQSIAELKLSITELNTAIFDINNKLNTFSLSISNESTEDNYLENEETNEVDENNEYENQEEDEQIDDESQLDNETDE